MIYIDSQIQLSDRDWMRKHVDREIWREFLSEACVNNFVFRYGEASYFRDIVVILFRGTAITVPLGLKAIFY